MFQFKIRIVSNAGIRRTLVGNAARFEPADCPPVGDRGPPRLSRFGQRRNDIVLEHERMT